MQILPRIFRQNIINKNLYRLYTNKSTLQACIECAPLLERSLLRISGPDAATFLQGLITNDINTTEPASYAMLLNPKGRILYDILLYKNRNDDEEYYLLECDVRVNTAIENHCKFYKLRSKVDIVNVDQELAVWWAKYNDRESLAFKNEPILRTKDPRLQKLGERIIIPRHKNLSEYAQNLINVNYQEYVDDRMKLGICEGVSEVITGESLPLEYNLDYLDGVKFDKGCYLGQELTARTYHTGVIRKRLMPVIFLNPIDDNAAFLGSTVLNDKNKNCGKLRALSGKYGVALLRIADSLSGLLSVKTTNNTEVTLTASKPLWWPQNN
ncbi:uncharacterized protein TRIADDRAFT_54782 [Trichoplax adhaerens]|uniref:Uncharacterized protein n=1 Tax=Trichoplax adhaerens TaxID=10228 RepID=B3RSZ5_TRIAD|nr:hypothetical protein TRIADDRAFT_54782 [Trichoplax adhaerens]EDV27135.1 hypothetical protein TRIADDRAFT_54782 [Trichoplax adhaerens]|eukprot:XP_002111131.1 hypothetical protein TRIADDRAFT_54782 [Trichoplax adhaerens]